ncbi:MAG TPA: ChbG/HpnK family deacetylase [Elusimicrobiales bacterium]|nr:ChbG/HpnK family deacetylase [Elusimicrobiales bacterium]
MKLKFIADDYGSSPAANSSILALTGKSVVSGVSVLPLDNLSYPDGSLALEWGAHLYLTEFSPLTPRVSALSDGKGLSKKQVLTMLFSGKLSCALMEAEFSAQLERLRTTGFELSFADTHMNLHWHPVVLRAMRSALSAAGIKGWIRPVAIKDFRGAWLKPAFSAILSRALGMGSGAFVLVNCPGYMGDDTSVDAGIFLWKKFVSSLVPDDEGRIIVPCHPHLSPAEARLYSYPGFESILREAGVL